MASETATSSAVFDCDRSYKSTSTLSKPIYYRIDWNGVELPRRPSLKLEDDEFFFQLIGSYHPKDMGSKRKRYLDFVRRFSNSSILEKRQLQFELGDEVSTKKYTPVPLRIRKKEIQLVQRKLPRYPSKRHLSKPSFYPLASSEPLQIFPVDIGSNNTNEEDVDEDFVDEDDDSETAADIICIADDQAFFNNYYEEEDEMVEESYNDENQTFFKENYEDDIEQELYEQVEDEMFKEVEEGNEESCNSDEEYMNDEELDKLQLIHSKNIEYVDQKERQRRLQLEQQHLHARETSCNVDDSSHDNSHGDSDDETESSTASHNNEEGEEEELTLPSPEELCQEDPIHEPKIGVVSPSVQSMIIQARLELRCRKVPEEHKNKFKHSLAQASEIGLFTRLDEHTVEAFGKRCEKYKAIELPSAIWKKGNETVILPHFNDATPAQFTIFKEAVALGGIKALKPKITTNFDNVASTKSYLEEEVDVDDSSKPKYMRTKYLTDLYLDSEHRGKSDNEDEDIDRVRYESLDDVKLPTNQCPVIKPVTTKMSSLELKELLSQKVAEKVWERRYRLERPRAQQRITDCCQCIYCKTSSSYQTFAYRKRWLVQQNLWNEPPPKVEPMIEVALESMTENDAEVRDDCSVNTENSSDTLHSDTFSIFATEEVDYTKIGSAKVETDNNGIVKSRTTKGESNMLSLSPKPIKTFMAEVQSLLRINHRSSDSPTHRSQKKIARKERRKNARKERLENVRKKRQEKDLTKRSKQGKKQSSNTSGFFTSGISNMHFFLGKSSHHKKMKSGHHA
eukprot:jgi/Psemu1/323541/estExt_fgenesh1_pg.C_780017